MKDGGGKVKSTWHALKMHEVRGDAPLFLTAFGLAPFSNKNLTTCQARCSDGVKKKMSGRAGSARACQEGSREDYRAGCESHVDASVITVRCRACKRVTVVMSCSFALSHCLADAWRNVR